MSRQALLALAIVAISVAPAGATPLRCTDPCTVLTNSAGYFTSVSEIGAGSTVVWSGSDESHPTADSVGPERCFNVPVGYGVTPIPVRFDVTDGVVTATTGPDSPTPVTRTCVTTTTLDDDTILLPYRCLLHPWMHGALVIESS